MIVSHLSLKNWRNFRNVDVSYETESFLRAPMHPGSPTSWTYSDSSEILSKGWRTSASNRGTRRLSKIRCLAARKEPDVKLKRVWQTAQ